MSVGALLSVATLLGYVVAPAADADQLVGRLDAALKSLSEAEDPRATLEKVGTMLDIVRRSPLETAGHFELQVTRTQALLTLAEDHWISGESSLARAYVDEAILASAGRLAVPKDLRGVLGLVRERQAAHPGAGTLRVRCWGEPCRVVLHGRNAGFGEIFDIGQLPLGTYSMVVVSAGKVVSRKDVTLSSDRPVETYRRGTPPRAVPIPYTPAIPRWVSAAGLATAGSLLIVGGSLSAIDGRCAPGLENPDTFPNDGFACARVHNTKRQSLALLGTGTVLAVGFAVQLATSKILERRHRKKQKSR